MAEKDSLAQSLSEEEDLANLTTPPVPRKKVSASGNSANASPTRSKRQGYKFTTEPNAKPTDFDFASQSKNGQGPNHHSTSSSEGDEDFELLSPEGDSSSSDAASSNKAAPQTPQKGNPTPHKRAAELAETGNDAITGANGSPPSSPAPKKRKNWQEYVAEDEAKKHRKGRDGSFIGPLEEEVRKRWAKILTPVLIALMAMVLGVYASNVFDQLPWAQNKTAGLAPKGGYTWKKARAEASNNFKKMAKQFPHQKQETWIQLNSAILSTLKKTEPDQPACITVLVPPSVSDQFSNCFVKKVAIQVNSAVAPIMQGLNDTKSAHAFPALIITPETFKKKTITDIHISLSNYLSQKGKAVVALQVAELTQEKDLLVFHGLCDNFMSIHKRATILFPVKVPQEVHNKYEWIHARGGDISMDVLNTAFAKVVSVDTGPALVARIADAVILLNEGDKCE